MEGDGLGLGIIDSSDSAHGEPLIIGNGLGSGLAVDLDPFAVVFAGLVGARIVVVTVGALVALVALEGSEPLSLGAFETVGLSHLVCAGAGCTGCTGLTLDTTGRLAGIYVVAIPVAVVADGPDSTVLAILTVNAILAVNAVGDVKGAAIAQGNACTVGDGIYGGDHCTAINSSLELVDLSGKLVDILLKRFDV